MKSESIAFIPAAVPMLPHRDGFFFPRRSQI
nr:MAG TPA: hypothetical protein [Caudoviricetes sp.]